LASARTLEGVRTTSTASWELPLYAYLGVGRKGVLRLRELVRFANQLTTLRMTDLWSAGFSFRAFDGSFPRLENDKGIFTEEYRGIRSGRLLIVPQYGGVGAADTTKPGWLARLSLRGTGSVNLGSTGRSRMSKSLCLIYSSCAPRGHRPSKHQAYTSLHDQR
jgi:hypothetical protein